MKTKPVVVKYIFKLEEEQTPVRGNAFASGNDAKDRKAEDEIIERLDNGNLAAWCCATVIASVEINGYTFVGVDSLGCCSYETEAELKKVCFEHYDMKKNALAALKENLEAIVTKGSVAAHLLTVLS